MRAVWALVLGSTSIAATMALVASTAAQLPDGILFDKARPVLLAPLATRSIVYDGDGREMALLFAEQDRQEVPLERVPKPVQTAVLTIEDREFYEHQGVSVRAGVRALVTNTETGEISQGGSTITQQLIKNSITGGSRTLDRKVREAVLAIQLEDQMSKHDILERYLNTVYLGHGAYGVQAGAETYWGKDVEDLGWQEAAMLAALIRNPVGYSPVGYPDLARSRRKLVADTLLRTDAIDEAQHEDIVTAPLPTQLFRRGEATESAQLVGANYFSETVKQQLLDMPELGATPTDRYLSVFEGGLRVYTTYDPTAQAQAELATRQVPDTGGRFFAGVAAIDPRSGAVRAMVGGPDFETSKTNYVTQGWRQPGSSFKTLVLLAALEAGYVPSDTISGTSPCRFPSPGEKKGYAEVENSGGAKGRVADLTSQTSSSSNCAYMRLGQTVGLDKVAELASRVGITTISDQGFREIPITDEIPLTLPIGAQEVHPMAMAGAYAAIANDGVYHEPYYIEKVTDSKGKVLYQHDDPGTRAFSVQTARLATAVLAKNVTGGTGRNARLKEQVAAGKTGTTQENADAWFVGFTPYLATSVWLGSPEGRSKIRIRGAEIMGGNYPARVWGAFNQAYHEGREPLPFPKAESTRKGKAIRYRNKYDSGAVRSTAKKPTSTTVPAPAPAPPAPAPPAGG